MGNSQPTYFPPAGWGVAMRLACDSSYMRVQSRLQAFSSEKQSCLSCLFLDLMRHASWSAWKCGMDVLRSVIPEYSCDKPPLLFRLKSIMDQLAHFGANHFLVALCTSLTLLCSPTPTIHCSPHVHCPSLPVGSFGLYDTSSSGSFHSVHIALALVLGFFSGVFFAGCLYLWWFKPKSRSLNQFGVTRSIANTR
jgi:hypothetical protein